MPNALILDLDGTLTEPLLDFPAIRRDMGLAPGAAILEALAAMSVDDRATANAELLRHESEAAARSTLNPGCRELLAWCEDHRMPTAILTRNSRQSADVVFQAHGIHVPHIICRDAAPPKPDPASITFAVRQLDPSIALDRHVWMVGDGVHDVEAALAAGVTAVWLSHGNTRPFDAVPDVTVRDLWALIELLNNG